MGQAKDRQNRREAKKAKRKLNHKVHVKAKNVESNKPDKEKGSNRPLKRRVAINSGSMRPIPPPNSPTI